MSETRKITVTVNGTRYEETVPVRVTLADFIRHQLGLTGTHLGCEHGVCGACTILLDGHSARSCLMLAVQADGHEILTVEGIAPNADTLHPLQEAFRDNHGLQCGFCTPGILTTLIEISARQSRSDRARSAHRHFRQSVPLHRLPEHRHRRARCGEAAAKITCSRAARIGGAHSGLIARRAVRDCSRNPEPVLDAVLFQPPCRQQ